jgi:hypothetical protein
MLALRRRHLDGQHLFARRNATHRFAVEFQQGGTIQQAQNNLVYGAASEFPDDEGHINKFCERPAPSVEFTGTFFCPNCPRSSLLPLRTWPVALSA